MRWLYAESVCSMSARERLQSVVNTAKIQTELTKYCDR